MIFLALVIISTVCSTLVSVWVPVISMGLPPPVDEVPKPPRITLGSDRFIACVEKKEENIKEFTTISINSSRGTSVQCPIRRNLPEKQTVQFSVTVGLFQL